MRRTLQLCSVALLACACSGENAPGAAGTAGGGGPQPAASEFTGAYEVPTQPELQAAAHFSVSGIEWAVTGSTARLIYDLPKELVGKNVRLAFSGEVDAAGAGALSGEAGSADCQVSATQVTCHETMPGLKPLEPDLGVVERLAAKTYAGPAQDRLDVARLFAVDPIGIVTFEPSSGSATENEAETVEQP